MQRLTEKVMRRLPKAELHCHLDGSVRIETLLELANEQGVELPAKDAEGLRDLVCVKDTCPSLVEYLRGFDITLKVLQTQYALTRSMYEICEDAYNDGVRYLEVRFSPILHMNAGLDLASVMEAVCEGRELARRHYPITVNIIVCAMRQMSCEISRNIAEVAWRYRHKGVCGFDLAGPENGFSSKLHRQAFDIIRQKGINCTLHSGEAAGWQSIRDSIRYCGANRIGHGVHLIDNPELLEYVVARRIPIESCPTSNVHTKAVERIEDHPIRKFFDAGAIIFPCTDNVVISSCTLTNEYMRVQEKFNFSVEEIVRMLDYGFQSAFVTSTERRRLRADALHETLSILLEEGYDISGILKNEIYYRSIGMDLSALVTSGTPQTNMIVSRDINKRLEGVPKEIIEAIPKSDLHCRLDGSVSIDLLWKEIEDAELDLETIAGRKFESKEELAVFLAEADEKGYSDVAKDITRKLLQNPGQIQRAVADILTRAVKDNVLYMELVVRPYAHTEGGLSISTVLQLVCHAVDDFMRRNPITVGVIVYASAAVDDPIRFKEMADLCVAARKVPSNHVVGFGIFGDTEIPRESFRFFLSTFKLLKEHNVPVSMSAGSEGVGTIVTAVHDAGASRICGAFKVHQFPRLMNYMACNGIPVELSRTPKMLRETEGASFTGNAFRLLFANEVPVAISSFRALMLNKTRAEQIEELVRECSLTTSELVMAMSAGFRYNFQDSKTNMKLQQEFYAKTLEVLKAHGIHDMFRVPYFPPIKH